MAYLPHSPQEREAMLAAIGVENLEDLFQDVPAAYRFPELNLPSALSEMETASEMREIAAGNETLHDLISFLGAGAYNHYVPAAVDHILRRGEFYTAYTPYQPEISQGTLQAIFEYQSMICDLTGMEVSNASHYDGATAVAEAIVMAQAKFRGKRKTVLLSPALNPQYRQTARTYLQYADTRFLGEDLPLDSAPDALIPLLSEEVALVIVQYPDFFGRIYDLSSLIRAAHEKGALVAVAANPIALGLLTPPGDMDADIVMGEGQPLGIPLSFGGPYLGYFTTRKKLVHKMAGRIVGESVDTRGQRAYVMTLTAREQHIKREHATSNICSNQGLMALAAAVYLSLLGKRGLRQVAELCYHKAHYAAEKIAAIPGFSLKFETPFFNEFVVKTPEPLDDILAHLLEHGILGGYDLGQDYLELQNHLLVAVTEMNSREEIDALVDVLSEARHD